MAHPVSALPVATPLVSLVEHLGRLTGERQRPRLEAVLVEALRDLTGANRVAYFKLQPMAEETLFWQAVETDAGGTRIDDDGISLPTRLISLDTRPEIAMLVAAGVPRFEPGTPGRFMLPVVGPGTAAGFIEAELAEPPDGQRTLLLQALLTTFRNVMGLLDYSEIDTLTGLFNRKTFDEHLMLILASLQDEDDTQSASLRQPRRRQAPPADGEPGMHWLAVLDIDHFKRINDNFGHLIGDEVLLMVANLMKGSFRFRDKLFRFGGEEFVVVLKPTAAVHAHAAFERFRSTLENHVFPQVGRVTISIGYAQIGLHDQPSVILDNADQALYWSKEHGRNRVSSYAALLASGELAPPPAIDSDIELF